MIALRTEAAVSIRPDLKFGDQCRGRRAHQHHRSLMGQHMYRAGQSLRGFRQPAGDNARSGAGAGFAHTELANSQTNFAWNVRLGASAKLLPMTCLI